MRSRRAIRHLGALAAAPAAGLLLAALGFAAAAFAAPPAGPPYPDPVNNQAVYDYAGIFDQATISSAESTIDAIETRTGAEVAVYTQIKPESDTLDLVNADAVALIDQWGVGRKGFDDGLVIMFDMQPNLCHGQVSLYAGSGFRASYLTDSQRQGIFDNDMMPLLRTCDMDGALLAALQKVDQAATPDHAAALNQARQLNAFIGFGLLLLSIWIVVFVLVYWQTRGRDPIYVDDNSVLMAAPPEGLTPAMATLLMDDSVSNRTVSAAFVDLAAHGLISFYEEEPGKQHVGLVIRNADMPLPGPEESLWHVVSAKRYAPKLTGFLGMLFNQFARTWPVGLAGPNDQPLDPSMAGYIKPTSMSTLSGAVSSFKTDLEQSAVDHRWLTGKPRTVIGKWLVFAVVLFVGAGVMAAWTLAAEASGGFMGTAGLGAAGLVTAVTAFFMPSRTMTGSMLRAQLLAYKRTLKWTLDQSRSMDEVVARRPLPWVDTPDLAMAWGVALGLNDEVDGVLRRTVEASAYSGRAVGWYPVWWGSSSHGWGNAAFAGGTAGGSAGMFSPSVVPDVGGMMAALNSIGSSTSSSGGGGGGGFGGGGGGGGGGAGGGF